MIATANTNTATEINPISTESDNLIWIWTPNGYEAVGLEDADGSVDSISFQTDSNSLPDEF